MISRIRPLTRHEQQWCRYANRWGARRWIVNYFRVISRLGDGAFWYCLMAMLVIIDGWDGVNATAHMAATGFTALVMYKSLKRWTRRPRPFAADNQIRPLIAPLDEFSFPSGHTLHAVSFTLVALHYYPWLWPILVPFAASVAISRVVLGLHYPSDVLAAATIGYALATLSLWNF